jgi:hypothetical protein
MHILNNSLLLIHPRQPMLDWLNALTPDAPISGDPDTLDMGTAFLLHDIENAREADEWLLEHLDIVMEEILCQWWTDEDDWPDPTPEVFEQFFSRRFVSYVVDSEIKHWDEDDAPEETPTA